MKPRLLFITPVMPCPTGNGTAMRSALVLRGLAQRYAVTLLVAPLYSPPETPPHPDIAAACESIVELPVPATNKVVAPLTLMAQSGSITPPLDRIFGGLAVDVRDFVGEQPFDVIHIFRLNAVPFAGPYLDMHGSRPWLQLDLDDIESSAASRLADLYGMKGDRPAAGLHRLLAHRLQAIEAECLRRFDCVYVCSDIDRARLERGSQARLCVVPNAVRLPSRPVTKQQHELFTFLFVGTLGYYPNVDALEFLCRSILPHIRERISRPFQVNIVGRGTSPAVTQLANLPDVRLIGDVPSVTPWYATADAVVTPIRAGGGTRIKILEAFAHGVPVVSTEMGIEGIAARDEEHLLLGDTPEQFARQCVRLMIDTELASSLTARAFALVEAAYSESAVLRRISDLACPPSATTRRGDRTYGERAGRLP